MNIPLSQACKTGSTPIPMILHLLRTKQLAQVNNINLWLSQIQECPSPCTFVGHLSFCFGKSCKCPMEGLSIHTNALGLKNRVQMHQHGTINMQTAFSCK